MNTQPTFVRAAWNWGLHVTSSCHRVKIYRVNSSRDVTMKRLEGFEKRRIPFVPITRLMEFPVEYEGVSPVLGGE
jgi:sulfite oxidase